MLEYKDLSSEQQRFINLAKTGKDILVDACIGSGKTTAIQVLCNEMPDENILYLTYNSLLKVDAKKKIRNPNAYVTNYHGYSWYAIKKYTGRNAGVDSCVREYLNENLPLLDDTITVLVIDEYQDISTYTANLIKYIKDNARGKLQIIAVGDMCQKLYDNTSLNAYDFMMGIMEEPEMLKFTKCFRLSADIAKALGDVWGKTIIGVNDGCKVTRMNLVDVAKYLSDKDPKDILCLGKRQGAMISVLNKLEQEYPQKFNKETVYATIKDREYNPPDNSKSAIFTTFDSSKGLERRYCIIFDYDLPNWSFRLNCPMVKYEIIRNIFLVAASRGKDEIIFVNNPRYRSLEFDDIKANAPMNTSFMMPFTPSSMFEHKYEEDLEECVSHLNLRTLNESGDIIPVDINDGNIDLSPAIGVWQQTFFDGFNLDDAIEYSEGLLLDTSGTDIGFLKSRLEKTKKKKVKNFSDYEKCLYLTFVQTLHERYVYQVNADELISSDSAYAIKTRLGTLFTGKESVEGNADIDFEDRDGNEYQIYGRYDAVKNNTVYELKFTTAISREHILQCAVYIYALNLDRGIVWNVRTGERIEITIKSGERAIFFNSVANAITKGVVKNAYVSGVSGYHCEEDSEEDDELLEAKKEEGERNLQSLRNLEAAFNALNVEGQGHL